jgi:hypothetical protein
MARFAARPQLSNHSRVHTVLCINEALQVEGIAHESTLLPCRADTQRPMKNGMPVPYRIRIADDVLKDLKARLRNTRWPDQLEGTGRVPPPREVCERRYTIARWTQTDKGGHFSNRKSRSSSRTTCAHSSAP